MTSHEIATMLATLYGMASGEARCVGREDIHVYRHSPAGHPVRFQVVTAEAETAWLDAASAVRHIEALFSKEARDVA